MKPWLAKWKRDLSTDLAMVSFDTEGACSQRNTTYPLHLICPRQTWAIEKMNHLLIHRPSQRPCKSCVPFTVICVCWASKQGCHENNGHTTAKCVWAWCHYA